jgi:hypothetical protein
VDRVAARAREPALEVGEGVYQADGLEGAVAPADRCLRQHAGVDEPRDRLVDRLFAAAGERRGALDGDDRRTR